MTNIKFAFSVHKGKDVTYVFTSETRTILYTKGDEGSFVTVTDAGNPGIRGFLGDGVTRNICDEHVDEIKHKVISLLADHVARLLEEVDMFQLELRTVGALPKKAFIVDKAQGFLMEMLGKQSIK